MKKNGIYNAKLSEVVGKMGHGDLFLLVMWDVHFQDMI